MSNNIGWIRLHRKILNWELYRDSNAFRVYLHFLLNANYEDSTWGNIVIKAGDYCFTYDSLAGNLGLTVRQIRFAIDKLKKCQNIVTRVAGRFQVVSIVKYNLFKDVENKIVSKMPNSCQEFVGELSTLKEDNKINIFKNNNSYELLQKEHGSRLDVNLKLSPQWKEFAIKQGLSDPDITFEQFKNYWTSPNAKRPIKKDWLATWRNWVLKEAKAKNNSFLPPSSHAKNSNLENPYEGMSATEIFKARGITL